MKLKAAGAFLARRKNMVLLDDGGKQWIGDGSNFYLLPEDLGRIDGKIACAIFDIEKEKAANWKIIRRDFPEGYDTSDTAYEDMLDYDLSCRILFNGQELLPAGAKGKTYLIPVKAMKPLSADVPNLAVRHHPGGAPYLVAKDGMFTEAIIMPVVTKPEMTGWLTDLCNGIASAHLYGKVDEIGTEE